MEPIPRALSEAWRRSAPGLAAVGAFSVVVNVLKLATPLFVLQLLDRVVDSASVETLAMLAAITLAAVAAGVALEALRRRLLIAWGGWIERRFGPALFERGLVSRPLGQPRIGPDLRDLATLRGFVGGQGATAWLDVIWTPVFLGVVWLIAWPLALIALAASICAAVMALMAERAARPHREASRRARAEDRDWVAVAEAGGETVGPLGMAGALTERWSASAFERQDESAAAQTRAVHLSAGLRLVARSMRVAVLGVGVWLAIGDALTVGGVIAANLLARTAFSGVQDAALRWRELSTALRAYGRLAKALAAEPPVAASLPDPGAPAPLRFRGVAHRPPHARASLFRGLSFALRPGETLAVTGPSGSGKTTVARLAVGLIEPRAGRVTLGELTVARRAAAEAGAIGYLAQEARLFGGPVRDNIARLGAADMALAVEAARLVGAHEAILALPEGYDTVIDEQDPRLSVGQRRSVALARAFFGRPRLIVLDEPETHLDRDGRRALDGAIAAAAARGAAVLYTTLSAERARRATRMLRLGPGGPALTENALDREDAR